MLGGVEKEEVQAERVACQSEHAAQLARAHHANGHARLDVSRGSEFASTLAVCCARCFSSAAPNSGCALARIAAALKAALVAPATPIANVATGIPAGICTIESSESRP